MLAVNAASLAKPEAITDADARAAYELEKAKFGTPERRTIQQITFPTQAEADAAAAKIKEGATFEAIAAERGGSTRRSRARHLHQSRDAGPGGRRRGFRAFRRTLSAPRSPDASAP